MYQILKARFQQKYRTMNYPEGEFPELPARFAGRPIITKKCGDSCQSCLDVCPTQAIQRDARGLQLNTGRCLFCRECEKACPSGVIEFSANHQLAAAKRDDLIVRFQSPERCKALNEEARKFFGNSLKLRQVSAGGCNACEADSNVLGTPAWDMGRFGIQFVASPRHADGLLITGPVTENMRLALRKTYDAVPEPKIVIAVGACAISGGPYMDHPQVQNGAAGEVPVDLCIPGCPPHPLTILDGLLRFLGKTPDRL
jgi:Ni,Fe-hydrogenase III small subunit/Pyruvate/2-oxoacid:ferredoxin oxidoreductase delta subunit